MVQYVGVLDGSDGDAQHDSAGNAGDAPALPTEEWLEQAGSVDGGDLVQQGCLPQSCGNHNVTVTDLTLSTKQG
jgi:hypothetical protein